MGYRTLRQCVVDLQAAGRLVVLDDEVDARLDAAEIHRRVWASGGPAILFAKVKGCQFPMVSNLFGTMDRVRYIFRDTLEAVRRLVELKIDPNNFFRRPSRYLRAPLAALTMLPKQVSRGSVLSHETKISQLPQMISWPDDGGPFITLPLVYTEDPTQPGLSHSNLGMYRVQLGGNDYAQDREVGLHYQIHRGIGVHHAAAQRAGQPLRVNVFVGGSPAMSVAAVMPLPEGMSELAFAGALAGHRIPMISLPNQLPIYAEADFAVVGTVDPNRTLPEGPFGDHLGYYAKVHDFPVLRVEKVYHRAGAIWPFTVVGRPPQEDTMFGELIHEITGPIIPTVIPGVKAVHAVDAAGVHPLMLAIGSERYTPYNPLRRPAEILTQACAILGQGQMSLAKYLVITTEDDAGSTSVSPRPEKLDIHNIVEFFAHVLRRVDWRRDLHFHTSTTIDTLDYSGSGLNEGSKLVIAAAGPPLRELPTELPSDLRLPDGFSNPQLALPGVLVVNAPPVGRDFVAVPSFDSTDVEPSLARFAEFFGPSDVINTFPLIVLADDSEFTARTASNFLWVTFTRSNPAADVQGIGAFTQQKHWGCRGSIIIDARIKPHHAPPLLEDPEVTRRVDALAARGGPLAKWL